MKVAVTPAFAQIGRRALPVPLMGRHQKRPEFVADREAPALNLCSALVEIDPARLPRVGQKRAFKTVGVQLTNLDDVHRVRQLLDRNRQPSRLACMSIQIVASWRFMARTRFQRGRAVPGHAPGTEQERSGLLSPFSSST
jgi:hypothetical protein